MSLDRNVGLLYDKVPFVGTEMGEDDAAELDKEDGGEGVLVLDVKFDAEGNVKDGMADGVLDALLDADVEDGRRTQIDTVKVRDCFALDNESSRLTVAYLGLSAATRECNPPEVNPCKQLALCC